MSEPEKRSVNLLVVVVNYFSAKLVANLTEQLSNQRLPEQVKLSIVCADNSVSPDQKKTLLDLKEQAKIDFKIVLNSNNLGFGSAINNCAKGQDFDFLCCINPDVTLFSDTLLALLAHCIDNPEQGIWGGHTVNEQHKLDYRHAWQEPSLRNTLAWAIGLKRLISKPPWHDNYRHLADNALTPYAVDCVSGCCLIISAEAWQATGGFDPDFFLYSEEVDLCLRARQLSFQPTVVPNAKLTHKAHSLSESINRTNTIHSSKLLYASKHHGFTYNICYRLLISLGAIVRTMKSVFNGQLTAAKIWANLALTSIIYRPKKRSVKLL